MPHISSKKLNSNLSEKLFRKLIALLGKAQDKQYLNIVTN